MLIIFLLCVIAIMAGVIVYIHGAPARVSNAALRKIGELTLDKEGLSNQVTRLTKSISSMEEGQQEIVDNYENDFLNFQAKIEHLEQSNIMLTEENSNLEAEALHHRQNCLPSLAGMTEMAREGVLGTYKVE